MTSNPAIDAAGTAAASQTLKADPMSGKFPLSSVFALELLLAGAILLAVSFH